MKNYGNLMYGVSDRILKVIAAVALAVVHERAVFLPLF